MELRLEFIHNLVHFNSYHKTNIEDGKKKLSDLLYLKNLEKKIEKNHDLY